MTDLIKTAVLTVDKNPAAIYLMRLGVRSRKVMLDALNLIAMRLTNGACNAVMFDWTSIKYHHSMALRAALMESYAPATVNRHLAGLRGVIKEAWRLGMISAEECARISDVKNIKNESLPAGRALSTNERSKLYQDCAKDTNKNLGARDAAVIALLDGCGLRRGELIALNIQDIDLVEFVIKVKKGKGQKQRSVPIPSKVVKMLIDWIDILDTVNGPLFVRISRVGRIIRNRITPQAVYKMLSTRAKRVGLDSFSPHDFRRTLISDMLDVGGDLATVAKMVGHANVQTTARYDRRGEIAQRRICDLRDIPVK